MSSRSLSVRSSFAAGEPQTRRSSGGFAGGIAPDRREQLLRRNTWSGSAIRIARSWCSANVSSTGSSVAGKRAGSAVEHEVADAQGARVFRWWRARRRTARMRLRSSAMRKGLVRWSSAPASRQVTILVSEPGSPRIERSPCHFRQPVAADRYRVHPGRGQTRWQAAARRGYRASPRRSPPRPQTRCQRHARTGPAHRRAAGAHAAGCRRPDTLQRAAVPGRAIRAAVRSGLGTRATLDARRIRQRRASDCTRR